MPNSYPHNATSLFFSCIDDRLIQHDIKFFSHTGSTFITRLAGGGGAFLDPDDRKVALKQIVSAYKISAVTEIYLQSHTDCGAYRLAGENFISLESEVARLHTDLETASKYVREALIEAGANPDHIKIHVRVVDPEGKLHDRVGANLRHILSTSQFSPELIERIFDYANRAGDAIEDSQRHERIGKRLKGHVLYRLFYKESTSTYESFGFAATHLGMDVLGTQSVQFSSEAKGDSLEDTVRTICSYRPSIIVLRSAHDGEAAIAAKVATVPIINAGDGSGEHPTQALLDLYTIYRELGRTHGLRIVMGGDLANGRTVRSLVKLAAKYPGNVFIFVAPPTFEMRDDILTELRDAGIEYHQTTEVLPALAKADVVYWTRIQKERISAAQKQYLDEHPNTESEYSLGLAEVSHMPAHAKLMHPLPRVGEIKPEVDADPRAVYFQQMHYGMLVRMGLIEYVLGYL